MRNYDSYGLWFGRPRFLLQGVLEPKPVTSAVIFRSTSIDVDLLSLENNTFLEQMIKRAPELYALKKRVA